jgi:hypothetical protein
MPSLLPTPRLPSHPTALYKLSVIRNLCQFARRIAELSHKLGLDIYWNFGAAQHINDSEPLPPIPPNRTYSKITMISIPTRYHHKIITTNQTPIPFVFDAFS